MLNTKVVRLSARAETGQKVRQILIDLKSHAYVQACSGVRGRTNVGQSRHRVKNDKLASALPRLFLKQASLSERRPAKSVLYCA
jgi:hypothetical protein